VVHAVTRKCWGNLTTSGTEQISGYPCTFESTSRLSEQELLSGFCCRLKAYAEGSDSDSN